MQWLSAFTIKGVRFHPEIMANYQEDGIRSDLTAFVNNLSMKQYVFGGGLNGELHSSENQGLFLSANRIS